jgi:hypothetical protein
MDVKKSYDENEKILRDMYALNMPRLSNLIHCPI